MFTNKKILELENENKKLRLEFKIMSDDFSFRLCQQADEIKNLRLNIENKIIQHTNEIETRLNLFHKEITDKYFATLERILKVHSETSLITALAHQVNQKDLNNLRTTLLKPFIEEKWRQEEISKGEKTDDNIKSFGQKLVIMRKELHEEMLRNERAGKNIAEFNGKIAILNMIIGDSL